MPKNTPTVAAKKKNGKKKKKRKKYPTAASAKTFKPWIVDHGVQTSHFYFYIIFRKMIRPQHFHNKFYMASCYRSLLVG